MHDSAIPESLIARVKSVVNKYDLFENQKRIIVALSGGKDSLFATLALKALGYEVVPVAVDLDYSAGWAARIQALAEELGVTAQVVPVRSTSFQNLLAPDIRQQLTDRLVILDSFGSAPLSSASPCTQCYNTKITVLTEMAERDNINWVVFGHHATDAIASMLKAAMMYVDRWDRGHEIFSLTHFSSLVDEFESLLQHLDDGENYLLHRVCELVAGHYAATDEPPVQLLNKAKPGIKIARPLFGIFEYEIADFQLKTSLIPEPSGCGHGATVDSQTPREMIQFRILRKLSQTLRGCEQLHMFYGLLETGLTSTGWLVSNVREKRNVLLGETYRSGFGTDTKL